MYLTYFVKQFATMMATPLMFGFLVGLVGTAAFFFRRRRTAAGLWIGAACLIYLSAIGPVANALLLPLETRYPPLSDVQSLPPVNSIVVLGSSYGPRDGIPITAALSGDGLARITEGVRLMRLISGARLIVSGGAAENGPTSASGYAELATDLGIDRGSIMKLDKSLDTADEAASVFAALGASPFILVTSAYHMPRAMRLMRSAGARPIAAPTGQLATHQIALGARAWMPTSGSLRKTECALHEYIGLAIAR